MKFFFIADIHLSENTPEITREFLNFISKIIHSDGLFILGDLFNFYLGDDCLSDYQNMIAKELNKLTIPKYLIVGNRDFLIGKQFAKLANIEILPDRYLWQEGILLEHGDLLCTADKSYQRLRKILHFPPLQKIYFLLPKTLKIFIANKLRKQSKNKSPIITDVEELTINEIKKVFNLTTLIHGHTHRPNIHQYENFTRFVLGDWNPDGLILIWENNQFSMIKSSEI